MRFTRSTYAIGFMALAISAPSAAQAGGAAPGKGPTASQNAAGFRYEGQGSQGHFGHAYGYGHGNGRSNSAGNGNGYGHDKGHGHGHNGNSNGHGHCKYDDRCHTSPG